MIGYERICLKKPIISRDGKPHDSPNVGDIDTVVQEKLYNERVFYVLERFDKKCSYLSTYFAILPDAEPESITEEETILQTV